ncbi:hypothetical protein D9M69_671960 [compost metagenome]
MRKDAQQAVVFLYRQDVAGLQVSHPLQDEEGGVVEEFVERGERLRGVPELHRIRELDLPWGRGQRLRRKHFGRCPEKCGAKGGVQVERARLDVRYELLQKLANWMHFCMRGRANEDKSLPRGK